MIKASIQAVDFISLEKQICTWHVCFLVISLIDGIDLTSLRFCLSALLDRRTSALEAFLTGLCFCLSGLLNQLALLP